MTSSRTLGATLATTTQNQYHTTPLGPRRIGPGHGKDIEQVRLQYQSPGLLSSSSESELRTVRSSDSCISSATLEPMSPSEATGGSQTSISVHSSASQYEIAVSEQEPASSTVSEHDSRSVTPTNPTRSRSQSPRAPVSGPDTNKQSQ